MTSRFSFFAFCEMLQRMVYTSMLLVGRRHLCFYIIYYGSHGCEKMSCGYKRLKNIVIRGSIKVKSMHVINNHLYSILKLREESENVYKLMYSYMVDWYTVVWT